MAFDIANLAPWPFLHQDTRLSVWDYATEDDLVDVSVGSSTGTGSTYFVSPAYKVFRTHDVLRVTAGDGKAIFRISTISPGNGVIVLAKIADCTSFEV